jgi:hypothetical protein
MKVRYKNDLFSSHIIISHCLIDVDVLSLTIHIHIHFHIHQCRLKAESFVRSLRMLSKLEEAILSHYGSSRKNIMGSSSGYFLLLKNNDQTLLLNRESRQHSITKNC